MKKTMKKTILLAAAACFAASASGAFAQTITGSISSPVSSASAPINLNSYNAFAYYGVQATANKAVDGSIATDVGNLASFSGLSSAADQYSDGAQTAGTTFISYSGAQATGSAAASLTAGNRPVVEVYPYSFSLTTKLIAPTESLSFYLEDGNTNSNFTATLGSTTYTLNDASLSGNDSVNPDGLLTLNITGGTVGEVLTFTDSVNSVVGNNSGYYTSVGIQAVGVSEAIPEPSTLAYMLGGMAALVGFARRKKLA